MWYQSGSIYLIKCAELSTLAVVVQQYVIDPTTKADVVVDDQVDQSTT